MVAPPKNERISQEDLPKGYGVLKVLVEDEDGEPLEGAEIKIANKRNGSYTTMSREDGSTKGAGMVSMNPFKLTVKLAGYETQERQGIVLSEKQPVSIAIKLKRPGK